MHFLIFAQYYLCTSFMYKVTCAKNVAAFLCDNSFTFKTLDFKQNNTSLCTIKFSQSVRSATVPPRQQHVWFTRMT